MTKQMPLPQPECHTFTQAAKTTTTVEGTQTKPPTVQQKQAELERALAPKAASPKTDAAASMLPRVANATSVAVNQDKLDAWASLPQISINFNGNTGTLEALMARR
jgi:hypothetical protein